MPATAPGLRTSRTKRADKRCTSWRTPGRFEKRCQVLRGPRPLQLANRPAPNLLRALPDRVRIGPFTARNTPVSSAPRCSCGIREGPPLTHRYEERAKRRSDECDSVNGRRISRRSSADPWRKLRTSGYVLVREKTSLCRASGSRSAVCRHHPTGQRR